MINFLQLANTIREITARVRPEDKKKAILDELAANATSLFSNIDHVLGNLQLASSAKALADDMEHVENSLNNIESDAEKILDNVDALASIHMSAFDHRRMKREALLSFENVKMDLAKSIDNAHKTAFSLKKFCLEIKKNKNITQQRLNLISRTATQLSQFPATVRPRIKMIMSKFPDVNVKKQEEPMSGNPLGESQIGHSDTTIRPDFSAFKREY